MLLLWSFSQLRNARTRRVIVYIHETTAFDAKVAGNRIEFAVNLRWDLCFGEEKIVWFGEEKVVLHKI